MSNLYHIVPWYNNNEWHKVYRDIYSENANLQDALNLLQIWKARCPSLPSGLESTLTLLQVHAEDVKSINVADEQVLRLAYSSAVMRFVNHMLDTETAKGSSLYNAAKNLGLPDWIIDLRHDTAHSNNLPSLVLLRSACDISLQWLQNNYWDRYKDALQDYTSGQLYVNSDSDGNSVAAMFYFYSCLSVCSNLNIEKLSDIKDVDMLDTIVNDARNLLNNSIDLSNPNTVSIKKLINLISIQAKKMLKSPDSVNEMHKSLLGEGSLFMSLELLEHLSEYEFRRGKLNRTYVRCFEVLLTYLHTDGLLLDFILALVELTKVCDCSKKSLLSALWLAEILKSLHKIKQFNDRAKIGSAVRATYMKQDFRVLFQHWFPSEKNELILDLQTPVPSKLADINFIKPILSSYNPYLTYFIKDLMNLVEPGIPKRVSDKICKLADLIAFPDKFPVKLPNKIYTPQDFDSCSLDSLNIANKIDNQAEQHFTGIWKLAQAERWHSCPIGQLPGPDEEQDIEMVNCDK